MQSEIDTLFFLSIIGMLLKSKLTKFLILTLYKEINK